MAVEYLRDVFDMSDMGGDFGIEIFGVRCVRINPIPDMLKRMLPAGPDFPIKETKEIKLPNGFRILPSNGGKDTLRISNSGDFVITPWPISSDIMVLHNNHRVVTPSMTPYGEGHDEPTEKCDPINIIQVNRYRLSGKENNNCASTPVPSGSATGGACVFSDSNFAERKFDVVMNKEKPCTVQPAPWKVYETTRAYVSCTHSGPDAPPYFEADPLEDPVFHKKDEKKLKGLLLCNGNEVSAVEYNYYQVVLRGQKTEKDKAGYVPDDAEYSISFGFPEAGIRKVEPVIMELVEHEAAPAAAAAGAAANPAFPVFSSPEKRKQWMDEAKAKMQQDQTLKDVTVGSPGSSVTESPSGAPSAAPEEEEVMTREKALLERAKRMVRAATCDMFTCPPPRCGVALPTVGSPAPSTSAAAAEKEKEGGVQAAPPQRKTKLPEDAWAGIPLRDTITAEEMMPASLPVLPRSGKPCDDDELPDAAALPGLTSTEQDLEKRKEQAKVVFHEDMRKPFDEEEATKATDLYLKSSPQRLLGKRSACVGSPVAAVFNRDDDVAAATASPTKKMKTTVDDVFADCDKSARHPTSDEMLKMCKAVETVSGSTLVHGITPCEGRIQVPASPVPCAVDGSSSSSSSSSSADRKELISLVVKICKAHAEITSLLSIAVSKLADGGFV